MQWKEGRKESGEEGKEGIDVKKNFVLILPRPQPISAIGDDSMVRRCSKSCPDGL